MYGPGSEGCGTVGSSRQVFDPQDSKLSYRSDSKDLLEMWAVDQRLGLHLR